MRGACCLQAVETEAAAYIDAHHDEIDEHGRRLVVRNGQANERTLVSGVGTLKVRAPRVNDRRVDEEGNKFRFTSQILPPYLRRTKSVEELIPWLYLKGISTGDFSDALKALLGPAAPGLSATTVVRLKQVWREEYETWSKRSLEGQRFVYLWADGIYSNIRLDDERQCLLVVIGALADGRKQLLAVHDGFRESELSWTELLEDLKRRGLEVPPKLAVGDGGLGFWAALQKVYPTTREQRCWVHKTANVLDKLPKSMQGKAKSALTQHLSGREPNRGGGGAGSLRRPLRGEVSQGRCVPRKGPRGLIDVLRLPGRALGASSNDESDRVNVRDGAPEATQNEGLRQPRSLADDGVHVGPSSGGSLAQTQRLGADGPRLRRKEIQGWRTDRTTRRLTRPVHNI